VSQNKIQYKNTSEASVYSKHIPGYVVSIIVRVEEMTKCLELDMSTDVKMQLFVLEYNCNERIFFRIYYRLLPPVTAFSFIRRLLEEFRWVTCKFFCSMFRASAAIYGTFICWIVASVLVH
jgi:hypothetical protein